jgi:TPR repeat protein
MSSSFFQGLLKGFRGWRKTTCGLIAALLLAMLCPLLAAQQPLDNPGVVRMLQAGLSDELVIAAIQAKPGKYDTSVDALVALKKAGASDKIILAMVRTSGEASSQKPAAAGHSEEGLDDHVFTKTEIDAFARDGKALYDNQHFAEAVVLFERACKGGVMESCDDLGFAFNTGRGVVMSVTRAFELYKKACDGGFALGCYNLGYLYENGSGVDKDLTQARLLYEKACNANISNGCSNLGVLYSLHEGVAQDDARALSLFLKSCDLGYALGCSNAGHAYWYGEGVHKDRKTSRKYLARACSGGYQPACPASGLQTAEQATETTYNPNPSLGNTLNLSSPAAPAGNSGDNAALEFQIQRLQGEIERSEKTLEMMEDPRKGNPVAAAGTRAAIARDQALLQQLQAKLAQSQR